MGIEIGLGNQPGNNYPNNGSNPACLKCTDPNSIKNYRVYQEENDDCGCNDEIRCSSCDNCKWCINKDYSGSCISKEKKCDSPKGHSNKERVCYLGKHKKRIPTRDFSGYNSQGCNLYDNYLKCLNCVKEKKCGLFYGEDGVKCGNPKNDKDNGCSGQTYNDNTWNCLNAPDDSPNAGFGCPNNKPPIDPKKNHNSVCENI